MRKFQCMYLDRKRLRHAAESSATLSGSCLFDRPQSGGDSRCAALPSATFHQAFSLRGPAFAVRAASVAVVAALLPQMLGCLEPARAKSQRPPLPALPVSQAVAIVNENIEKIGGTLRASGSVDGFFTREDGRRVHYDVSGVLFYLEPHYLRFDLKKLGDRQLLFGSNDTMYWVFTKEDDAYRCEEQGAPANLPADLPARPDQIPDALGLTRVPQPDSAAAMGTQQTHRVVDKFQQLLFLAPDAGGRLAIQKEYWLDRHPPRLMRHVVFRDAQGAIEMASDLGDYELLGANGPHLPTEMKAHWPKAGAQMRFRVSKWELVPQVGPEGPQFATPPECASRPGA